MIKNLRAREKTFCSLLSASTKKRADPLQINSLHTFKSSFDLKKNIHPIFLSRLDSFTISRILSQIGIDRDLPGRYGK